MKSRKQRSGRKKAPSDVSPSTSLPPLVEGQLRCFLQVTISRVLWTVHKPPSAAFIRLRWWGESTNGTHFFPRDGSQLSQKTIKTTARFPIRCGPKQFTSYLTDMGSLVLEVLTKPDHLPIARAQVVGISRLTLSHPISGFYTLVSPTSEKLGELQVSLSLEPLTEAYDSSSSGPATDISMEGLKVTKLTVPSQQQHRSLSAGSGKESAGNTPRGKDHLYFQNAPKDKEETLENQRPITNKSQNNQTAVNPSSQEFHRGQATSDLLSVILERGNKLRNAMVVSALNCDMDSAPALKDTPLPLPKDNIQPPSKSTPSPSGMFLENILNADSPLKPSDDAAVLSLDISADVDNRAVDLLLGSSITSLPLWDGQGSSPGSLSDHGDSELNDPQYDQSLLENLFYKTPISVTRSDDTEEEPKKTPSSRKTQPKHPTQSGPRINKDSDSEHQQSADAVGECPHLSVEQLSFLSLIRMVKVTVDSLTVPAFSSTTTPRKTSSKAKPARPIISKKCTYFVEYVFPMANASTRHDGSKTGGGQVTRAVSTKVTGGAARFQQLSVFPVHFSPATVQQWWDSDLLFKIYSRKSDQKKPVAIGKAVHPLRCLLDSKQLSHTVVLPVQSLDNNNETHQVGPLKVSLELGADSRSLSSERFKSKLTWRDAADSPEREAMSTSHPAGREELAAGSLEDSRLNGPCPHPGLLTAPPKPWQQVEQEDPEVLLLHALLMVPDGKNFSRGPAQAPNVYLNCRLFWCDETARSVISWGHSNPSFNFVQVTPVALTTKLLERMKNNMMVIEVWQRTGSSGQDRLLGLVKLPLHQFYMSFRDPSIALLLLQAQLPVLGVDCYMPVIDVFSGSCTGNLRVVLAMGRSEQILSLQRTRDEQHESLSHLVRPVHLLDHQLHPQTKVNATLKEPMREHVFVIRVEKVSGLMPLQSTVWGEADCYIQYSFPCQEAGVSTDLDGGLIDSSLTLKPFRTSTALCIPDPVFTHTETHVLVVPEGLPVQRLLLSCLSGPGGVHFEVWCRYYYPNVRDQLVARGILPLSKLCAMVTMQRQHPNEAQMFSLPLIPRTESPPGLQPQPSGLLDVCIGYKPEGQPGRAAASNAVMLVVEVHRASGLKAAARVLSEQDERFSYFAGVGLNSFVTVQLSFLPDSERRSTCTASRSFCPEFNHHMEVCCDLLLQRSSGGSSSSLAEQLEKASAVCTVWNRDNRRALDLSRPKDVMLGTVEIPLADLIHRTTGISGWFGVYQTQETSCSQQQQHVLVGGLEVSISFAHHSDRERAIKAAQGLGWEMPQTDDEESLRKLSVTFSMPRVWIPVHCLLLPGHSELQPSTYCYFRYKFYEQEAFCSQMKQPCVEQEAGQDAGQEAGQDGHATVSFEGSRSVELNSTQPFLWYLREERLEVQVWVAFNKHKARRPSDTDRLLGSAFIDLSSLAKTSKQKLTLSGVYPLFRRSAADLQGAAVRVHITLTAASDPGEVSAGVHTQLDSDSLEELLLEEAEAADRVPSPTTLTASCTQTKHKKKSSRAAADMTSVQHPGTSREESLFPVTVAVDRAMHLSLKGCPSAECSETPPCCWVSYITADSAQPVSTAVISNNDCPVWDHQHECRLLKQQLIDPQQSLVFKVWHKGEVERVIGFASVDLSPLLCGFPSVCGWYNITDFSGQCHGQLKVSVTPLRGLQDLREQRKTANEEAAKSSAALFQSAPVSYQTSATYSSFPSHISRYTEQKISSPDLSDRLFSGRSSESDRHFEHMDKVRLYHQNLQEQTASQSVGSSSSCADINPCSSFLFSALRRKLSELDNIQRYFSGKLSTPSFPPLPEQDCNKQRDSETDSSQLLLKSNQLVGQVNNIISGLRGHHLETIPSNPQSSSTTSPVGDNNLQTFPESVSSPHRVCDCSLEIPSPLASPLPEMSEDQTASEPDEEKDKRSSEVNISEDEDEEQAGCRRDSDDEEEDEDYEEVVVKPRTLNEVTSLTDKTSPWTSIMSDPDLVSLGSLETPEEPDMSEDEERQMENPKHQDCSEKQSDRQSFNGSNEDASDTETDDEETLKVLEERQAQEPSSSNKESGDSVQVLTGPHNASSSLDNQHAHLQPSVPVQVPNFFLSSHQLEASMRTIRLAPSFCQTPSDPEQSAAGHSVPPPRPRNPPQPPNMWPSSMKKEAERIAKIFTARFDDTH